MFRLGKCFPFHNWNNWEQYKVTGNMYAGILAPKSIRGKLMEFIEIRERRCCKECNTMQDRLVRDI